MMEEALREAEKARLNAPPNPWVGAVLERKGEVLSRGHTAPCGGPHAEVQALEGIDARGATLYVTLEPCCHHGKTPPCCEAIIAAGIKKVVVGSFDPDPLVAGKGVAQLKEKGIEVVVGVLEEKVLQQLAPYIHQRQTGKPLVVAKAAVSADGQIAAVDSSSQWISSEEARAHAHRLRAESGAILVGSGTYLTDNPRLTVRSGEIPRKQPKRVVVDRSGRCEKKEGWHFSSLSPGELLKSLGKEGILQVLLEGGSTLLTSFLEENLVDVLYLYVGNVLLGSGLPLTKLNVPTLKQARRMQLASVQKLGETALLEYLF